VSFHGGPLGFDTVLWRALIDGEEPELFSSSEIESIQSLPPGSYALFCSISPHGNQGYPGDLLTEVLISLVPSSTGHAGYIVIVYRSKLIGIEKVVTPVNLSQNLSFNLDASLANSQWPEVASVTDHRIAIGVSPRLSKCPSDLKFDWVFRRQTTLHGRLDLMSQRWNFYTSRPYPPMIFDNCK